MANTLDKIEVHPKHKHLQIRELTDSGGYHRRVLTSDMTLAEDEHQEIKDKAEAEWTDEVKASWTKFQAEQRAKLEGE
jgi:hypothetical protein